LVLADDDFDIVRTRPVEYPESDGKPVGESEEHADALFEGVQILRDWFERDPLVYVSGNNFLYFTEGVPRDVVCPDVYVVKGVPKLIDGRKRRTFKVWEEGGRTPCFVLEITSRSTRVEDLGTKMVRYRDDLHVDEYVLFDLSRDWIEAGLRGYRLVNGEYRQIEAGPDGRIFCQQLGLELAVRDGRTLRFFEPGADTPLPTRAERAERAEGRAERAEEELRRLRAELERLRGPS
jgi:Uma2 family endonuclease